ncbi:hypothetical protein EVAR_65546_1 [Eumeta japonica]|uniref:Uncharacterized protein n=1 Tax=Eumeta variegata TaxID=151549 RepID=A0A4C1ZML0_EUMVA|nr:hypothetical protein EVAR_65546_1 [Eumeta japonica]
MLTQFFKSIAFASEDTGFPNHGQIIPPPPNLQSSELCRSRLHIPQPYFSCCATCLQQVLNATKLIRSYIAPTVIHLATSDYFQVHGQDPGRNRQSIGTHRPVDLGHKDQSWTLRSEQRTPHLVETCPTEPYRSRVGDDRNKSSPIYQPQCCVIAEAKVAVNTLAQDPHISCRSNGCAPEPQNRLLRPLVVLYLFSLFRPLNCLPPPHSLNQHRLNRHPAGKGSLNKSQEALSTKQVPPPIPGVPHCEHLRPRPAANYIRQIRLFANTGNSVNDRYTFGSIACPSLPLGKTTSLPIFPNVRETHLPPHTYIVVISVAAAFHASSMILGPIPSKPGRLVLDATQTPTAYQRRRLAGGRHQRHIARISL